MIKLYLENNVSFATPDSLKNSQCTVVDCDTFTASIGLDHPCCLNFAAQEQPGGGYEAVMDLPMPIRTQEEDLFRRSNLPELMDNPVVRSYYPLRELKAIYCSGVIVSKDQQLNPVEPFEVAVISMAAVVNPRPDQKSLVASKIKRILEIAAENQHANLVLGAWGCGVFNNDPRFIASTFLQFLTNEFDHVFEKVIFAIPGKNSENYIIFREFINGLKSNTRSDKSIISSSNNFQ
jgi:uncharacterized protein (TIGR02452 family)